MDDNSSSAFSFDDEPSLQSEMTGGVCRKGKRGEPKVKSGVFIIKRKQEGKTKKVHLFNTADYRNSRMVNAVTGIPYSDEGIKFMMGSEHEDSIFKVRFVTRENNIPGLVLCYDNPEQYESHTFCTLNDKIKKAWEDKNLEYRLRIARREREKDRKKYYTIT
jgi:hypothetical protein